jgi:hypothetical protein
MSTLTTHTTASRDSHSIGLCKFNTTSKAIEVSDGTNWTLYNNDGFYMSPITNRYAVNFDGSNDYMSIPDADIFSLGNGSGTDNAFSISAWFNADSIGTFVIAAKDNSGAREWELRTISSQLHFYAFGTGGGYIGRNYTSILNSGQWYHVVVTYDGSKSSSGIKLYLDGSRVDNGDYSGGTYTAANNTTTELRIAYAEINSTTGDGKIDEVAIFNSELSLADVNSLRNTDGADPKPTSAALRNPVGWWRMGDDDGGSGSTITDQGTGGNDGTLTNGPTFHDLSTAPDSIYVAP